jgi:hypothetical protein
VAAQSLAPESALLGTAAQTPHVPLSAGVIFTIRRSLLT